MLQQTQVDRVVPYYERFVDAYPSPATCAAGGSAEVVRRWSGLGYNRRALNLHRAATSIVDHHDGQVPSADAELRTLPGVGAYTARAVRSFGFGQDVAAVDTNGVRVLARAVAGSPLSATAAFTLGDRLVPRAGSWEFNQSMFDLGATVCRARPDCGRCPLRRQCSWRRRGGGDPWRASPAARPQSPFSGSDRQGRGRLLEALRVADISAGDVAAACGWPDDVVRAERVAASLVEEGFARWRGTSNPLLRLR
jgi:A/G-specific adenine glycosylase